MEKTGEKPPALPSLKETAPVFDFTASSSLDFALDEAFQYWVSHPHHEEAGLFWERWLSEYPEKQELAEEARRMVRQINFTNFKLRPNDVEELWKKTKRQDVPAANAAPVRMTRLLWTAIACCFLNSLAGIVLLLSDPVIEHTTAYGETKNIVLPDGSVEMLNTNSSLRHQKEWDTRSAREVWVDGKAYFKVAHKTNRKLFQVHTGDGFLIGVEGTEFNVYCRHNATKVVLNSGRIQLKVLTATRQRKVEMEPGEMVEYQSRQYSKYMVNPSLFSAWTMSRLELNHTSLREMVQMLRDNYGLEVRTKNAGLLDQTVSGSMPLDDAANLIQQKGNAFRLTIRREGDVFWLDPVIALKSSASIVIVKIKPAYGARRYKT